ncbi:MAG: hypothetical protein R3D84_14340 [Paracoccaceae bacterium]
MFGDVAGIVTARSAGDTRPIAAGTGFVVVIMAAAAAMAIVVIAVVAATAATTATPAVIIVARTIAARVVAVAATAGFRQDDLCVAIGKHGCGNAQPEGAGRGGNGRNRSQRKGSDSEFELRFHEWPPFFCHPEIAITRRRTLRPKGSVAKRIGPTRRQTKV